MGEVVINDVDIRSWDTRKLRRSITMVAENPVLFSGSLRRNLDPDFEYDDEEVWAALEKVCLKMIASFKNNIK